MRSGWDPRGARELHFGLVGLGAMGRNHLRVLSGLDGVRLVAVADPVATLVEAAAARTGATAFADVATMLAEVDLDGLVIAAPTTQHRDVAIAAVERGVAVLVEKPLAGSIADAEAIVAAARVTGVPVAVGHVERFNPAVRELGRLLRDGWLSAVYAIASRRSGPFPERIRDVGVTIDLATHDVDILSWIARERPARVYAETAQRIHAAHEDLLFGLLHFPSGTVAQLDVDWLTPVKRRQLVVVGEEGMFELDYLSQRLTFTRATDTTNPRLIGGYAPTFEGDVVEMAVGESEPLVLELESFVNTVRTGGRPEVDVEDGLWAVRIAVALLEAAHERRVAELGPTPSITEQVG